jgi:hypothetical protein
MGYKAKKPNRHQLKKNNTSIVHQKQRSPKAKIKDSKQATRRAPHEGSNIIPYQARKNKSCEQTGGSILQITLGAKQWEGNQEQ